MDSLFTDRAFQAGLRGTLAALMVIGVALLIRQAWDVVEPLIIATVLASILWPWASKISAFSVGPTGWRLPRPVATALIFLASFSTVGLVTWLGLLTVLPQVEQGLVAYPDQAAAVRRYLEPFRTGDLAGGARQAVEDAAGEAAQSGRDSAPSGNARATPPVDVRPLAVGLFGGFVRLGLVAIFTFFLLLEGDRLAEGLLLAVPDGRRIRARALGLRIRDRVSRWVLAQALYGTVSGLIIGVAMWILQLPSPWLYGLLGATLGVFPGLGPWVATVPAFLVAIGLSTWKAAAVALFGIAMYVADSTAISTRIYGGVLRLPMFVVLLALFLGGALMGVWGALIATPIAAALDVVVRDHLRRPAMPGPSEPAEAHPAMARPPTGNT